MRFYDWLAILHVHMVWSVARQAGLQIKVSTITAECAHPFSLQRTSRSLPRLYTGFLAALPSHTGFINRRNRYAGNTLWSLRVTSKPHTGLRGATIRQDREEKIVLLGSILLISCWSTATLAFVLKTTSPIYLAYPLWSLSAMATPVLDAVLADSVSPHDRSRIYSLFMLANVIPGALTGYATGILVGRLHPQFFLGLAALLESAGFVLIQSKLRNVRLPPVELAAEAEITSFKRLMGDFREYYRLFGVFAADSLSWSIATTLLPAIL